MTDIQYKERYTQAELVAMMLAEHADPTNRNPDYPSKSIFLHTKKCRVKTDAMARAITWHLADKRAAADRPVIADGYSGRQTNKR